MKHHPTLLILLSIILPFLKTSGQSSSDIYQKIKKLEETTTVLYVAAHPDDENTRLISWMSKERQFRTAYISLTRGDGGQNLIGAELGVDLGLIRTRELMAARAIDGGEQYFTRAFDFGYSKTSEETIEIWEREKILEDLVYVIRKIKPDIMICRFPPDDRAGHGHHSSSAILTREAFECAADPKKFPGQVPLLGTCQVKRLYWNTFRFGSNNTTSEQQLKTDVGGFSTLLGKSYGELAAESRSQHKSQGFGVAAQRGTQIEYFSPVAGDTNVRDIFLCENFWLTQKNGNEIIRKIKNTLSQFDFNKPSASVMALLEIRKLIAGIPDHPVKSQKTKEINQIIVDCLGIWSSAYSFCENYTKDDTLHVNLQLILRGYDSLQVNLMKSPNNDSLLNITLKQQQLISKSIVLKGPGALSQPYWLHQQHDKGTFIITDKELTGNAWNPPAIELKTEILLHKDTIPLLIPVTYKVTDPVKGESIQPVVFSPIITGRLSEKNSVFIRPERRKYKLMLNYSGSKPDSITLRAKITGDPAWETDFTDTVLFFSFKGEEQQIEFTIYPKQKKLQASGLTFYYQLNNKPAMLLMGQKDIRYDHIPPITWFPELKTVLKTENIQINCSKILYIKGAGDEVAAMIRQTGVQVDETNAEHLSEINLEGYDAIVTGIRAYNTDKNLPSVFNKIMGYVKNGGTFLVQYNTNSNLHPSSYMTPYPYTISRNRVTEEDAPVTFANEKHSILNYPNKITPADFNDWVQERGLYFATKTDSAFTNILLMNDKGEKPQEGSLIAAKYGKGTYIYTGLSFFRQLPAGVPGAFRLFANLISQKSAKEKTE